MTGAGINHFLIVDDHIHPPGDAVQFCHSCIGSPNDGPANVYIGRNEMNEDEENALDLKEFLGPVIVSQNRVWGYRALGYSGAGEAIRVNDEGLQGELWIIFNDIWDSSIGVNAQGAAANGIYVIGNEIHDIVTQSATAIYPVPPDGGSASMRVVNNTLVNVTKGIMVGETKSNIIKATGIAIGSSAIACSHNFVQQGTIQPTCATGYSGNPLLIMNGIHVTGLQPNSPAKDVASRPLAYAIFRTIWSEHQGRPRGRTTTFRSGRTSAHMSPAGPPPSHPFPSPSPCRAVASPSPSFTVTGPSRLTGVCHGDLATMTCGFANRWVGPCCPVRGRGGLNRTGVSMVGCLRRGTPCHTTHRRLRSASPSLVRGTVCEPRPGAAVAFPRPASGSVNDGDAPSRHWCQHSRVRPANARRPSPCTIPAPWRG